MHIKIDCRILKDIFFKVTSSWLGFKVGREGSIMTLGDLLKEWADRGNERERDGLEDVHTYIIKGGFRNRIERIS